MLVFFVLLLASSTFYISEGADKNDVNSTSRSFSFSFASSKSSSSSSSAFASASSRYTKTPKSGGKTSCICDQCTPTCSIPNPPNCPQSLTSSPDRCNCDSGYILSEKGGKCVKLEDCQKYKNCNGDRNASYTECPNTCVSTCSKPNAPPCRRQCEPPGCQCDPLYLLSDEGQCISPDDCPGGNPCGQNKTFVYCNAKCPPSYCPVDDNRAIAVCDPPYPCPSGCACQRNYKLLSFEDERCVLASDCPPVECTRQFEVWNSCPPQCFTDSCRDLNTPTQECVGSGPDCQPQCVCQDGYRRNDSDICVTISDCTTDT